LEREHDNFRAALGWAHSTGDAVYLGRLGSSLQWFWYLHSHLDDGTNWLSRAQTLCHEQGLRVDPEVLLGYGALLTARGLFSDALAVLNEAAQTCSERPALHAEVLLHLAICHARTGDPSGASRLFVEAEQVALVSKDPWTLGRVRQLGGRLSPKALDARLDAVLESHRLFDELGDAWGMAMAANSIGCLTSEAGDVVDAARWFARSISNFETVWNGHACELVQANLGEASQMAGDHLEAARSCLRGLLFPVRFGDPWSTAVCLYGVGGALAWLGRPMVAAQLLGGAEAHVEELDFPISLSEQHNRNLARLRSELDPVTLERAWRQGRGTDFASLTALAKRVVEELDQPTPPQRPSLTRRELEVLRLVADGLSDADIARRLFIARKTASRHIESILSKLACSNRTAAATLAMRNGLLAS
jgi:DNA-binding CsgD family transcriptional regulator